MRPRSLLLTLPIVVASFLNGNSSIQAAPGDISGELRTAGGFALVVFGGGGIDLLISSADVRGCTIRTVWATFNGEFVPYVAGAPVLVNEHFLSGFSGENIPSNTGMIVECDTRPASVSVGHVPAELGLDPFYAKYVDADGIPVVGSSAVPDAALLRAREIVLGMLKGIAPEVRQALVDGPLRVAVMAQSEVTTDIPEHKDLNIAFPEVDWNARARGLGATESRPASTAAEENLLCYPTDSYRGENIMVHEFAHTILGMGIAVAPGGIEFVQRVNAAYEAALSNNLWQDTYAATSPDEYWAEAAQSWFNANRESNPPDGIHNTVDNRDELRAYDPAIASLVEEVLPTSWLPGECN